MDKKLSDNECAKIADDLNVICTKLWLTNKELWEYCIDEATDNAFDKNFVSGYEAHVYAQSKAISRFIEKNKN